MFTMLRPVTFKNKNRVVLLAIKLKYLNGCLSKWNTKCVGEIILLCVYLSY